MRMGKCLRDTLSVLFPLIPVNAVDMEDYSISSPSAGRTGYDSINMQKGTDCWLAAEMAMATDRD